MIPFAVIVVTKAASTMILPPMVSVNVMESPNDSHAQTAAKTGSRLKRGLGVVPENKLPVSTCCSRTALSP
jgi:hypothetical protein